MVGKKVMAKHLLDLKSAKSTLDNLEIKNVIIEASDEVPLHALYCEIPSEINNEPWKLFLSFLPTSEDDLDTIKLMQCYAEVVQPSDLLNLTKNALSEVINNLNNEILFGKYAIIDGKLVYRYMQNTPQFYDLEVSYLEALLKWIAYNIDYGLNEIKQITSSK